MITKSTPPAGKVADTILTDERALFEAWFMSSDGPFGKHANPNWLRRESDGSYDQIQTDHRWMGWQARAALARSQPQGEPVATFIFPYDAWNDYAALSGLVGEDGIAPQPSTTQAAHSAYMAAWNSCHAAFSAYIARGPVAQPVTPLQEPDQAQEPQSLCNSALRAEPASQHTNTYRISFMVRCPNNDHVIRYGLSIESASTIMVEDIVAAVAALPAEGFHEDIAAQLASVLPGRQTITAHHHGVDIETLRGLAA